MSFTNLQTGFDSRTNKRCSTPDCSHSFVAFLCHLRDHDPRLGNIPIDRFRYCKVPSDDFHFYESKAPFLADEALFRRQLAYDTFSSLVNSNLRSFLYLLVSPYLASISLLAGRNPVAMKYPWHVRHVDRHVDRVKKLVTSKQWSRSRFLSSFDWLYLAAWPMKTLGSADLKGLLKKMAADLETYRLLYKSLGVLNVPTLSVILDGFF